MSKSEYCKQWRAKHPLHTTHIGMLQRCGQKHGCRSASNLRRYRDRGIRVCDEWRHFPTFEAWAMKHGWRKGLQIDRIDPDKDYSPDNCRIVTPKENSRHRCNNLRIRYRGKDYCLAELVEKFGGGMKYSTVHCRLSRGWTIENALLLRRMSSKR